MSEALNALSGLTNPDFEISGATFRVNKLKGIEGFDLLELIREAMAGSSMSNIVGDGVDESAAGARMMSAIASIETKYVKQMREIAFRNMDVKLPAADRFVTAGSQESAINDLIEPIDNYEIIVRFIAVNFTKSTADLLSRIGLGAEAVAQTSPQ
jgi:hypothetical protein